MSFFLFTWVRPLIAASSWPRAQPPYRAAGLGVPTAVIPDPWFVRMTPTEASNAGTRRQVRHRHAYRSRSAELPRLANAVARSDHDPRDAVGAARGAASAHRTALTPSQGLRPGRQVGSTAPGIESMRGWADAMFYDKAVVLTGEKPYTGAHYRCSQPVPTLPASPQWAKRTRGARRQLVPASERAGHRPVGGEGQRYPGTMRIRRSRSP